MHHIVDVSYFVRVDQAGVICKQEGIFRVNCMDCLDRTNVVQAAVARVVMEQQVRSVPRLVPGKEMSINVTTFVVQYCGSVMPCSYCLLNVIYYFLYQ